MTSSKEAIVATLDSVSTRTPEQVRDIEAAARAHAAVRDRHSGQVAPEPAGIPRGFLEFSAQVSFFTTIGYLTQDQANQLLQWYLNSGLFKLPVLPGPDNGPTPNMYEIMTTAIHFGTPAEIRDLSPEELATADIGDFFSGLASAVGDLVSTIADGVTQVLEAGTGLIEAATALVHELHEVIVLAA
jgi:hypothetical protein